MSSVLMPRSRSTRYSSSPKSSPTGPTMRTSVKKLAASEKCTAEPPSMRSRSPNGVFTESKAIDPTTTRLMGGAAYLEGTMRAIRIDEWGGPEVMQFVEMPAPEPREGEGRRHERGAAGQADGRRPRDRHDVERGEAAAGTRTGRGSRARPGRGPPREGRHRLRDRRRQAVRPLVRRFESVRARRAVR